MPFGNNMKTVNTKDNKIDINNNLSSNKKKNRIYPKDENDMSQNYYSKSKKNNFKIDSYNSDKNDMSWVNKPWYELTPSQLSARNDIDSIMDY